MYAAQLFDAARRALGDLDAMFAEGEFSPLRAWLQRSIHQHGRRFPSRELVARVTGAPASPQALIEHLERRFASP
jgi:carboxypeptidase Taq